MPNQQANTISFIRTVSPAEVAMTAGFENRLIQALSLLCIVGVLTGIHRYATDYYYSNGRRLQSKSRYSIIHSDPRTIILKVDEKHYKINHDTDAVSEIPEITPDVIDLANVPQLTEYARNTVDQQQQQQQQQQPHPPSDCSSNLSSQINDSRQFLSHIHTLQNPPDCQTARILLKNPLGPEYTTNGLCVKINEIGKMLEIAVATHRTLVISPEWRSHYEPENCDESHVWNCLWEPVTRCETSGEEQQQQQPDPEDKVPSGRVEGITKGEWSEWFNVYHYGPQRVALAPQWNQYNQRWHIDIVPGWERTHGMFWVRAHVAHYLWRPNEMLKAHIEERMPEEVTDGRRRYIAFHVRLTDNIEHFDNGFGRDGKELKSFDKFMGYANEIRESVGGDGKSLDTIYVASDNEEVIAATRSEEWANWNFLFQQNVVRSTGEIGYDWFRDGRSEAAAAVCTDIEVMRRADFLVGSFHSNVYRLATQLNLAWNIEKYPINQDRFRTVDIEWYEDP